MNIQSDVVTQIRGESEKDDKNKYFFVRAYFILDTILVIFYKFTHLFKVSQAFG